MRHIISFSGGLGSAVSALVAHEQGLDFDLVFADTMIEDEDLYRFIEDVARAIGKEIVYLRDGRTPWDVFRDVRYHGNTRTAHCSQVLKTQQVRAWLDENTAPDDVLVLGMDWSESDRIERAQKVWAPRPVVSLLDQFEIVRSQYNDYLKRYDLKKPRLYALGFPHNNCGGFCVRSGLGQHRLLLKHFPERYAQHEQAQAELIEEIPTARPNLRQTDANGVLQYITMRSFREQVEEEPEQMDLFSEGPFGCGCFVDD